MNTIRVGAHVSTSGGFEKALERANAIGANTIQLFGASPVQWRAPLPEKEITQRFISEAKRLNINPIFLHAPYLINLASQKGDIAKLSKILLQKHLSIAQAMGAKGVIFHIGSGGDRDQKETTYMVARALKDILDLVPGEEMLIIENSAGAGNLVGDSLEEIENIIALESNGRIGFCFDTAHAYEAGVIKTYTKKEVEKLVMEITNRIGIERMVAVHLNDSKTPAGSNKDRHENIGDGMIGYDGIKAFVQHPIIKKLPLLLEVPGLDGRGPDKENIDRVIRLMVS